MTSRARRLRRKQTDAKRTLWFAVRRNAVAGAPFRRQQPIGPYVVDFYCSRAKLVVEIDGGQHNETATAARDAKRTRWFEGEGYRVLRFWNNDVLTNLEGVVESIRLAILDTPLPGPPPQVGRETEAQVPHATVTSRSQNRRRKP